MSGSKCDGTDTVVYGDGRYTLGLTDEKPYLKVGNETFMLTCHPYEPCLYITGKKGSMTAVHNAFDPLSVLKIFRGGETVTSITGREYDAKDFCQMVEYAAGLYNIQIDEAEKAFGQRPKRKDQKPQKTKEKAACEKSTPHPKEGGIIKDGPFFELLKNYPDCVIDYCLVKSEHIEKGRNDHRMALVWAANALFTDENGEVIWHFDVAKADAREISADELFSFPKDGEKLTYRRAFLEPPYGGSYTGDDFHKLNAALFPNGTDDLEIYEWTTDWSEYFDEGHEWWGTLCVTVYDKSLDRFAVILASATD